MHTASKILLAVIFLAISIDPILAQGFREPLEPGTPAPELSGKDQDGREVMLKHSLEEGRAAVLIFYRGSWCPHCEKHLSNIQDSLPMILDRNADVIVVSPETPESSEKIISATGAEFSILHDSDYSIMKAYHVDFMISDETVTRYNSIVRKKTAAANGNNDGMLPVPATYVINPDGAIVWVHYDPDYRKRSSVADILKALGN